MPNKPLALYTYSPDGHLWVVEFRGSEAERDAMRAAGMQIGEVVHVEYQDDEEAQEEARFLWWQTETVCPQAVDRWVREIGERVRG